MQKANKKRNQNYSFKDSPLTLRGMACEFCTFKMKSAKMVEDHYPVLMIQFIYWTKVS